MELIEVMRRAALDLILQKQGESRRDPRLNVAQKGQAGNEGIVHNFPVDISQQTALQVTTPGADFGKFYFMPDYDDPGGGGGGGIQ